MKSSGVNSAEGGEVMEMMTTVLLAAVLGIVAGFLGGWYVFRKRKIA